MQLHYVDVLNVLSSWLAATPKKNEIDADPAFYQYATRRRTENFHFLLSWLQKLAYSHFQLFRMHETITTATTMNSP